MALNIVGVCVHGLGGNLFSTGMDTLAAELNRITPVGCHFTVRGGNDPRLEDATITSDLLSALVKGATVIYIGHSLGADSALRFAQAAHNFRLPLICPVDPVSWDSNAQQVVPGRWEVGSNVARVIGYRTNAFPGGGRIVLAAGNTATNLTDTTLDVPDASPPSGLDIASRCSRRIAAGQANIRARDESWRFTSQPTITRPSALAPSPQPRQLRRRKRYHQNTSLKGPLLDADRGSRSNAD
jgi:pimeloyl-ACP methyl ester carboxylesterase